MEQDARIDSLLQQSGSLEAELATARASLHTSMQAASAAQEQARKELAYRDAQLDELRQQIRLLADADGSRQSEQRTQLAALLTKINELRVANDSQVHRIKFTAGCSLDTVLVSQCVAPACCYMPHAGC
jgi:hypothetical protein